MKPSVASARVMLWEDVLHPEREVGGAHLEVARLRLDLVAGRLRRQSMRQLAAVGTLQAQQHVGVGGIEPVDGHRGSRQPSDPVDAQPLHMSAAEKASTRLGHHHVLGEAQTEAEALVLATGRDLPEHVVGVGSRLADLEVARAHLVGSGGQRQGDRGTCDGREEEALHGEPAVTLSGHSTVTS
jgi:hypothetical protein